jgi:calreticulin
MFGPDICGSSKRRTLSILNYDKKDDNLLIKKEVNCETDDLSHLYTGHSLRQYFEVLIDKCRCERRPSRRIRFPGAEGNQGTLKPADWVETAKMLDPVRNPMVGDDIPKEIVGSGGCQARRLG